jgi:tartrate dehydratase beta subunit/fumarate hydratase class I family protein
MHQTINIDVVTEAVAERLMERSGMGLRVDESVVKWMLIDEVGAERADELLDRVLAQPIIEATIEVANMVFDVDEPIVNAGGLYFEIPGGTADYMRDAL